MFVLNVCLLFFVWFGVGVHFVCVLSVCCFCDFDSLCACRFVCFDDFVPLGLGGFGFGFALIFVSGSLIAWICMLVLCVLRWL